MLKLCSLPASTRIPEFTTIPENSATMIFSGIGVGICILFPFSNNSLVWDHKKAIQLLTLCPSKQVNAPQPCLVCCWGNCRETIAPSGVNRCQGPPCSDHVGPENLTGFGAVTTAVFGHVWQSWPKPTRGLWDRWSGPHVETFSPQVWPSTSRRCCWDAG